MKFLPQLISGLIMVVLGMAAVIFGALAKINHYTFFSIDGNLLLALGMLMQLIGIGLAVWAAFKNIRK